MARTLIKQWFYYRYREIDLWLCVSKNGYYGVAAWKATQMDTDKDWIHIKRHGRGWSQISDACARDLESWDLATGRWPMVGIIIEEEFQQRCIVSNKYRYFSSFHTFFLCDKFKKYIETRRENGRECNLQGVSEDTWKTMNYFANFESRTTLRRVLDHYATNWKVFSRYWKQKNTVFDGKMIIFFIFHLHGVQKRFLEVSCYVYHSILVWETMTCLLVISRLKKKNHSYHFLYFTNGDRHADESTEYVQIENGSDEEIAIDGMVNKFGFCEFFIYADWICMNDNWR